VRVNRRLTRIGKPENKCWKLSLFLYLNRLFQTVGYMIMDKSKGKKVTGLVLSGGGARGYAHLGVIKALNEAAIFPDIISGTSAGAIAGVLYADGYTPEEIGNTQ